MPASNAVVPQYHMHTKCLANLKHQFSGTDTLSQHEKIMYLVLYCQKRCLNPDLLLHQRRLVVAAGLFGTELQKVVVVKRGLGLLVAFANIRTARNNVLLVVPPFLYAINRPDWEPHVLRILEHKEINKTKERTCSWNLRNKDDRPNWEPHVLRILEHKEMNKTKERTCSWNLRNKDDRIPPSNAVVLQYHMLTKCLADLKHQVTTCLLA
nr:hypothetical protein [Tanacetum cinerariifolium]